MRASFPYRKKDSQNTEATSFFSEKTHNKVLSVQKSSSVKLSEFLYQNGEAESRQKSISLVEILT